MDSASDLNAAPSALRCSPVRLYEFNAIVSYNVVVAATSEADARHAISSWEQAWPHNSEFQEVCHVDLVDERELGGQTKQWATDEANEVSIEAYKLLSDD